MEIKNLKKASSRIIKAVKNKEKIIIFGDSDLDGVASVIILKESIKNLGCKDIVVYFSDREKHGYGINKNTVKEVKKHSPGLFISLDCGIANFKEIKALKKNKFDVIVIDHHEILDEGLPQADIIVDPKQKGDKYPFKQFANVGLVYKLAQVLLKDKMTDNLKKDFLELAAIATIADMMPQTDDNEEIIIEGLSSLRESWRPGIQALLSLDSLKCLSITQQVNKINALLNIRDAENEYPASFRLLTISNDKEAGEMVEILIEKHAEKRKRIKDIVRQVESRISKDNIIFEGSSDWELILLGIVASILTQKYQRPVFLYAKNDKESQGSVRAPAGFNVVEAMKGFSKNLITYGGHPKAAGFRIKNKYLEKFKQVLIDYFDLLS